MTGNYGRLIGVLVVGADPALFHVCSRPKTAHALVDAVMMSFDVVDYEDVLVVHSITRKGFHPSSWGILRTRPESGQE